LQQRGRPKLKVVGAFSFGPPSVGRLISMSFPSIICCLVSDLEGWSVAGPSALGDVAIWKTVFLGVFAGAKHSRDRHGSG